MMSQSEFKRIEKRLDSLYNKIPKELKNVVSNIVEIEIKLEAECGQ